MEMVLSDKVLVLLGEYLQAQLEESVLRQADSINSQNNQRDFTCFVKFKILPVL